MQFFSILLRRWRCIGNSENGISHNVAWQLMLTGTEISGAVVM